MHLDDVRAMQHAITNSRGTDHVGLYCAQLLDLGALDNALAEWTSTER